VVAARGEPEANQIACRSPSGVLWHEVTSIGSPFGIRSAVLSNALGVRLRRWRFHQLHGVAMLGAFGAIVAVLFVSESFVFLPEALAVLAVPALLVVLGHFSARAKAPGPELPPVPSGARAIKSGQITEAGRE
jgi:hypothetical protein